TSSEPRIHHENQLSSGALLARRTLIKKPTQLLARAISTRIRKMVPTMPGHRNPLRIQYPPPLNSLAMRRVVIPDLLDTDSGTPSEVAAALSDLRNINRWFGGIDATQSMIARLARELRGTSLTLLEVAAGAGYVPQVASQRMRNLG